MQHVPSEKGAASLHAGRPVFGIGFQGRSFVWVPLKPHLGVSCIWRLLNFAVWPGRKPFGGAENSSIGFICELKKQVRLCPVLFGEGQSAISDRARIAHGASQIPTPAHTAGTGLKPAAYGLNAHLELQVLNGGARNRRRPCGGGDQPAFRSSPAKPAPEQAAVDSANGYLAGGGLGPAPPTRAPRKSLLVRQPGEHRPDHEDGESNHHPILEAHPVRIDPHADASLTLVLN